jgi:glutamine synthetase adenylyltransferase
LKKKISDTENDRLTNHLNIEQLQNQMTDMQESHQRVRDEYQRILKQENELLNEQIKQHLTEQPSTNIKIINESSSSSQPEKFLYKYLNA